MSARTEHPNPITTKISQETLAEIERKLGWLGNSQEYVMDEITKPDHKLPGEKEEGTFHYNPGNMSGKSIGAEQDSTDQTENRESDIKSVLEAITAARTMLISYVEGDANNDRLVINRLLGIFNDGTLLETTKRLKLA
jgi:hypothetical protein